MESGKSCLIEVLLNAKEERSTGLPNINRGAAGTVHAIDNTPFPAGDGILFPKDELRNGKKRIETSPEFVKLQSF